MSDLMTKAERAAARKMMARPRGRIEVTHVPARVLRHALDTIDALEDQAQMLRNELGESSQCVRLQGKQIDELEAELATVTEGRDALRRCAEMADGELAERDQWRERAERAEATAFGALNRLRYAQEVDNDGDRNLVRAIIDEVVEALEATNED